MGQKFASIQKLLLKNCVGRVLTMKHSHSLSRLVVVEFWPLPIDAGAPMPHIYLEILHCNMNLGKRRG